MLSHRPRGGPGAFGGGQSSLAWRTNTNAPRKIRNNEVMPISESPSPSAAVPGGSWKPPGPGPSGGSSEGPRQPSSSSPPPPPPPWSTGGPPPACGRAAGRRSGGAGSGGASTPLLLPEGENANHSLIGTSLHLPAACGSGEARRHAAGPGQWGERRAVQLLLSALPQEVASVEARALSRGDRAEQRAVRRDEVPARRVHAQTVDARPAGLGVVLAVTVEVELVAVVWRRVREEVLVEEWADLGQAPRRTSTRTGAGSRAGTRCRSRP